MQGNKSEVNISFQFDVSNDLNDFLFLFFYASPGLSKFWVIVVAILSAVALLLLAVFGAFVGYKRLSKRKEGKTTKTMSPNS